jgi:hypothetical protein
MMIIVFFAESSSSDDNSFEAKMTLNMIYLIIIVQISHIVYSVMAVVYFLYNYFMKRR